MGLLRMLVVLYMVLYLTIYFGLIAALVYIRATIVKDKYVYA